jgi:hypothetical protein
MAMLAGALASWLLGAAGTAGVSEWTTTFQVQCSGEPSGYYIQAIGNLLNKQGRAMVLDGSKTNPLFAAPCWSNLPDTFTYTHTTKHEPAQATLNWYVVGVYTGETLFVCSPGGTVAAIPASLLSNCGTYGSVSVNVTTTK